MKCEICRKDIGDDIVLLPIRQQNGNLQTLACLPCSVESGLFCQEHQIPHLGFEDDTTACVRCIEDHVLTQGEKVVGLFAMKVEQSPLSGIIKRRIEDWHQQMHIFVNNPELGDLFLSTRIHTTHHFLNIARLIITRSLRYKVTAEEVIDQVVTIEPQVILPILED